MIISIASIADWLNFLFRCFLIVRIVGVIFCYFNLLMSILVMMFTILEEFLHSIGVIRAVMLRRRDVVLVSNWLVLVQLCAYCRYHDFETTTLKLCLVLTLRPRKVLIRTTSFQVYTLTVGDYHVLNFQLHNLAIVLTVIEVAS